MKYTCLSECHELELCYVDRSYCVMFVLARDSFAYVRRAGCMRNCCDLLGYCMDTDIETSIIAEDAKNLLGISSFSVFL